MKTEAWVRAYRDDLKKAVKLPCHCEPMRHSAECYIGGEMMFAVIHALSSILDESPEHDRLVEHIAAELRK